MYLYHIYRYKPMIPDPSNPASQAYMTQQYVQQTPTTPQQIYYQEGPKDSHQKFYLNSLDIFSEESVFLF